MYHGDVPDDIGQALVQQREDDNVQRGPLGLETEPEAKPLAGGGGTARAAGSSVSRLGLGAVRLPSRHRGGTHRVPGRGMETKAASLKQERGPIRTAPELLDSGRAGCPRIEGHQGAAEPSIAPAGGVEKGQGQTRTPTGHSGEVQTPKSGEAATLPGEETKAAAGGQEPSSEHVTNGCRVISPPTPTGSPSVQWTRSVSVRFPQGLQARHCTRRRCYLTSPSLRHHKAGRQ